MLHNKLHHRTRKSSKCDLHPSIQAAESSYLTTIHYIVTQDGSNIGYHLYVIQSNYILNLHYSKLPPVMKDKRMFINKKRIFGMVCNLVQPLPEDFLANGCPYSFLPVRSSHRVIFPNCRPDHPTPFRPVFGFSMSTEQV